ALSLLWVMLDGVDFTPLAVEVLRAAQQQRPNDFWINATLGYRLAESKPSRDGEAIRFYQAALALRPDNVTVRINLGNALSRPGALQGALPEYRKAIELDPKDAGAHVYLGDALGEKGDLDGAVAEFRKAIELDPKGAVAHCNLGRVLQLQGEFRE